MNTLLRCLPILLLLSACQSGDADSATPGAPVYLFLNEGALSGAFEHGDAVRLSGEELHVQNVLNGRDTVISLSAARNVLTATSTGTLQLTATVGPDRRQRLLPLEGFGAVPSSDRLTRSPYRYRYAGQDYWASFEPSFTGFPEYTRPGALDFVNRLMDWSATAPGLEFSEYRLVTDYAQPLLILSERERGQYLDNQIIVIDSVADEDFAGRVVRAGSAGDSPVKFTAIDGLADDYGPESFVERVNAGYSRSYLLLDRGQAEAVAKDEKRLPRRSFIDPGDLGTISASFLDDGSVMFLSDDHIVLQGSYVLDLDKGLLTVTDDNGAGYRIFVTTEKGIAFTLPVSVVTLAGSGLRGQDNYLRIEVVPG